MSGPTRFFSTQREQRSPLGVNGMEVKRGWQENYSYVINPKIMNGTRLFYFF